MRNNNLLRAARTADDLQLTIQNKEKLGVAVTNIPEKFAISEGSFRTIIADDVNLLLVQLRGELVMPRFGACCRSLAQRASVRNGTNGWKRRKT